MIYQSSSKTCGKQYIDRLSSNDHFRSRWNNDKNDVGKAHSGNMKNVNERFLQSQILQRDYQDFLEDVEVRLIDEKQSSGPNKSEFY